MLASIVCVWRGYRLLARSIRLPLFVFSGLLPLLGAAASRPLAAPSVGQILLLVGVALCVHIYASLLNDVVDLPIDRTQSWRQDDPLVAGTFRPRAAVAGALLPIPLAFAMTSLLAAPLGAYLTLTGAFLGLAIYNVWGKRAGFPPLTDAIQGAGWSMLVLYGALAISSRPAPTVVVPCAYIVLYTLLASGIHGNLRDLANDFAHHARTTAILLGARPGPVGPTLSGPVLIYGLAVQVALAATLLLPLALGWVGLAGGVRGVTLAVVLALQVPSFAYWLLLPRVIHHRARLLLCVAAHSLVMLSALIALYFLNLDPRLRLALLAVCVVPWLSGRKYPESPFTKRPPHERPLLVSSPRGSSLGPEQLHTGMDQPDRAGEEA